MAKHLRNLIRLHEWELDEKRRKLGELLRMVAELERRAHMLKDEIRNEQRIAALSPNEAGFFYGGYAESTIERREWISDSIAKTEAETEAARGEVLAAHQELKKFEITQEERDRLEAAEAARKEQIFLDEVGLQSFRQRSK